MTAILGVAVAAGAGFALFTAHSSPTTALRAEPAAREATTRSAIPAEEGESTALSGTVLETIAASSYTYLRLSTANGEIWTAVPTTSVAVGTHVTVENATKMTSFKSATLKRTFDVIYFGTLSSGAPKTAAPRFSPADALANEDEQDLPPGHPDVAGSALDTGSTDNLPAGHPNVDGASASPHGASPSAPASALPALAIAPARGSNARTITQLGSERAQLTGQKVRVRGQVTKVTPGVQGHTFLHLRDGDPNGAQQATDLAVTSNATPERGQVATFEGTLRTNVDLGIGYSYPILLENAELVTE